MEGEFVQEEEETKKKRS